MLKILYQDAVHLHQLIMKFFLTNVEIENWITQNQRTPDDDPVNILVAWHVIHSSSGLGNIPDSQIEDAVAILTISTTNYLIFILL